MLVNNAGIAGNSGANIFKRASRSLTLTIKGFAGNREGNVVFLFAFMSTVLFLFAGGAVDFSRWNAVRADMIESMDAAGLAMAQMDAMNGPEIKDLSPEERTLYLKEEGRKFFNENFKHASLVEDLAVDFEISTSRITPKATGKMKTLFLGIGQRLLGGESSGSLSYLNLSSETEIVRRDDGNIEVAMVLDITGSMSGSRITDLQTAAKDMVDIVVRDDQSEWYSKMALVPYSMGVNAGSYASQVRGSVPSGIAITNVQGKIGTPKGISNVYKENPARIKTSESHGFSNGDTVWIAGVNSDDYGYKDMDNNINNEAYTIIYVDSDEFKLSGVDGTEWTDTYQSSSNDFATKCVAANCEILVTAPSHGFSTNDYVHIDGVIGFTRIDGDNSKPQINNSVTNSGYGDDYWRITKVDNSNFTLQNSFGLDYNDYTSGGWAYCTAQGCEYYRFQNEDYNYRAMRVTSCVSERVGSNQYTDAAPSTTHVGRVYKGSGNTCPAEAIMPLSIDKTALKASIDNYVAAGSTAGQIGVAWGWYMLSPNFSYLFPEASQPAPYDDEETTKVAVIMTDGEFNTPYCNGVIAADATSGSGGSSDHINCNATNGDPYEQAEDMCDAMKAEPNNIVVYTIGFDISDSQDVTDLLTNCASGPDYVYFAATGDELKDIYRNIGSEITKLHIGK